jgi:uncharacterized protein YyaL (SSP411 family)
MNTTDQDLGSTNGDAFFNHLADESSPYLRQHANNPVDWYPWCDEALNRAKQENKPIFLSVGYSACHWCHVMERESFTDAGIARFLNDHFISIKVDREERPDIDEIYMTAVQILTGSGGWPLNVFLTPKLEPFYGGTYFPPVDGYDRPGFGSLLQFIADTWRDGPDQVGQSANNLTLALRRIGDRTGVSDTPVDQSILLGAEAALKQSFDSEWGGFGGAPKFPPTGSIAFLLRQYRHTESPELLRMATLTLDRMAQGGMHDHVGGGFHRYSVDEQWLVPHFEKMLYDNALLARVYLEAALVTDSEVYRAVARNTLDFVLRDMTDGSGGFHCALDADSEGEEGRFYVWSRDEVVTVLGEENATTFCEYYGVTDGGNFEDSNVLHYTDESREAALQRFAAQGELDTRLSKWCERLREVRSKREWPGKDDKVLASWNGLMISALARGYRVLREKKYLSAAERSADFIMSELYQNGELQHKHSRRNGEDRLGTDTIPGFLDDYAEMANALIDLYESSLNGRWLGHAVTLTKRMIADFHDSEEGGFFFTSKSHDNLLVRTKPYHDGAVPSGNSTAALVLLRLSRFLDDDDLREKAVEIFDNVQELMATHPEAFTQLLSAVDFHLDSPSEVVLAGESGSPNTDRLLQVIQARFAPNEIVALIAPDEGEESELAIAPTLLEGKTMKGGAATAYVCRGYVCHQPVTDPEDLRRLLVDGE